MDIRRLVVGTIAGAVTLYIAGYLIFDLAVLDFYLANAGSATGAFRDAAMQWPLILGNIALAALLTLGVLSRPAAAGVPGGLVTGLVIGFLVWFGVDFTLYAYTNLWNLTVVIVDPVLEAIHNGIAGVVIAWVLTKTPAPAG